MKSPTRGGQEVPRRALAHFRPQRGIQRCESLLHVPPLSFTLRMCIRTDESKRTKVKDKSWQLFSELKRLAYSGN